jgi:hypothetical protein
LEERTRRLDATVGNLNLGVANTVVIMSNKSIFYKGNDDDDNDKPKRKIRGDKATTFFTITVVSAAVLVALKLYTLWFWPW